jgi:hypothetical protein
MEADARDVGIHILRELLIKAERSGEVLARDEDLPEFEIAAPVAEADAVADPELREAEVAVDALSCQIEVDEPVGRRRIPAERCIAIVLRSLRVSDGNTLAVLMHVAELEPRLGHFAFQCLHE